MTQFEKLVAYANSRLDGTGLTISEYGISEMRKRFKEPKSNGGYSEYWHNL